MHYPYLFIASYLFPKHHFLCCDIVHNNIRSGTMSVDAQVCNTAQFTDSDSTCADATLTILNNTADTSFVIIPSLRRQPGGTCITLDGVTAPFILTPRAKSTFSIPTVVGGTGGTPPSGTVAPYYPYAESSRRLFVDVTFLVLLSSGVTNSDLQAHTADMGSYLGGGASGSQIADLDSTMTARFEVNTCGAAGKEYSVGGDGTEINLTKYQVTAVQTAAHHPARNGDPTILSLAFESARDAPVDLEEMNGEVWLTDAQRASLLLPYEVLFGGIILVLLVFGVVYSVKYHNLWAKMFEDNKVRAAGYTVGRRRYANERSATRGRPWGSTSIGDSYDG